MKQQFFIKKLMFFAALSLVTMAFISEKIPENSYATEDSNADPKSLFLSQWEVSKTYTLELIEAMPEKSFNYKPVDVDSVRTYAQQFKHLGIVIFGMNSIFIKDEEPQIPDPNLEQQGLSKTEVKAFIAASFDAMSESVKGLSEKQLNEKRVMLFMPGKPELTKFQYLDFVRDHCAHHRGQAIMYLRNFGITPPAYKYFPAK